MQKGRRMKPEDKAKIQQALEALESFLTDDLRPIRAAESINALRQLLEQPEPVQEPKFAPYWAVTDMEGKHIKVNIDTQGLEIYEEQRWAQANVQSNTKATLVYITRTTPPAQPAPVQEPEPACWQGDDCCPNRNACCDAQHCLYTTPPAQPADPDYKQLYEQLCEQYDVLVNELKAAQPADHSEQHLDMVDHGDELTIAYLDGVHTGKQIAKRVPLTDEQIDLLINGRGDEDDDDYVEPTGDGFGLTDEDLVKLVRRVEKHHGIEGTP
jgi:hypothetical protein